MTPEPDQELRIVIKEWLTTRIEQGVDLAKTIDDEWDFTVESRVWPNGSYEYSDLAESAAAAYALRDHEAWRAIASVILKCGIHASPVILNPSFSAILYQITALLSIGEWTIAGKTADISISKRMDVLNPDDIMSKATLLALVARHQEADVCLNDVDSLIKKGALTRREKSYSDKMIPVLRAFTKSKWDEFAEACKYADATCAENLAHNMRTSKRGDTINVNEFDYLNCSLSVLLFSAKRRGAEVPQLKFADTDWLKTGN